MRSADEPINLGLAWGMNALAFVCGCGIAFFLMAFAYAATPFSPHVLLLLMGVLSFGLTAAVPSAWWAIGFCIGLWPVTILMADPYYLALLLAFGPAFVGYWLERRSR